MAHSDKAQNIPDDEILYLKGVQLFENQNIEEALQSFRQSSHRNVDRAETQYMLGCCYQHLGQAQKAVDHYQIAGVLAPQHTPCWVNLAKTRLSLGRQEEALSAVRQARKHAKDPHSEDLLTLLYYCITPLQDFDITPQLVEEVTRCFDAPFLASEKLVRVAQTLLQKQAVIKTLLEHYTPTKFRDFSTLLANPAVNWPVLSHPLFISLLSNHQLYSLDLEKVFTALRGHVLEKASKSDLSDTQLWPGALSFLCALAQQCFMNEYIYSVSEAELSKVSDLESKLLKEQALNPFDIAILGCYRPLHTLDCAQSILQNPDLQQDTHLSALITAQIKEPFEEKEILGTLESLTSIDDEISLLVKEQYEAFPYPRWKRIQRKKPFSLRKILQFQFPHFDTDLLPDEASRPNILIAGCGTGHQSIGNALLTPQADYTAIDITAASLAYAIRKTKEMGIENIRYGLGDILHIDDLKQQFDMIYCGGVLHHMRDPLEGWKALYDVLKPGGFMMIGLYSDIARRQVVSAREYIAQQGIENTTEGIRDMRSHVKRLPKDHPMKYLTNLRDFHSISECRDLIFHVQEHRFTLPEIRKALDTLGLTFLGFQKPMAAGVLESYRNSFPDDPHAVDLRAWHEFELQNPTSFAGMYQFWLHKPKD